MNFLRAALVTIYTTFSLMAMATENDQLNCITDRDVYVSGDKIMVNVFVSSQSDTRTVYVDLSTFSGNHISGVKLMVDNYRAQGSIQIPDSLKTGTYLLRTFYDQDQQKKLHIRDLLIANRFEDYSNDFTGQLNKMDSPPEFDDADIHIAAPDTLDRREDNTLKITLKQDLTENLEAGLCISISKYSKSFKSAENCFSDHILTNESSLTEKHGLVISGRVIRKDNRLPVADATVYLSVSDSIPGFQYNMTGKDGKFHFLMKNIYGTLPVVIQAIKENENEQIKVLLDEKFNFTLPRFPFRTIQKDFEMASELKNATEAFTYSKIFYDLPSASNTSIKSYNNPFLFYGEPTYKVKPDEFYNLPDFTEISRELLVGVKFREKNNKLTLHVMDHETSRYFEDQALLLVDGIPVQDLSLIKDMGTTDITWIHTVMEYRFFGDITFPGVVSIHTRKADLNWLKESDRLIKYKFEGLQHQENNAEIIIPGNYPDLRPLLLWEPNILPSTEMKFNFKSSDIAGDFRIQVTGKKKNGELIHSSKIIHIK